MGIYSKKAGENFLKGYNCAQSVLLAFADILELDNTTILRLSSSFGGGMGRLREVCGAVSSMFMIAGLLKGYSVPNDDDIKGAHYQLIQKLANTVKEDLGSYICRDLLSLPEGADDPFPSKRTDEYYKKRPCQKIIEKVTDIIETELLN